jgi:lipoprotein-releasing system permease protein
VFSPVERFVSSRYLFSREKNILTSTITLVAVLGVAVGVAALIIVLGVMDGAERDLFGKVIELYPHVRVEASGDGKLNDPRALEERARSIAGVRLAEAVIQEQALFSNALGQQAEVVAGQMLGVDDLDESHIYNVRLAEDGGTLELGEREILLGAPLAERLGVRPGDSVLAIAGLTSDQASRSSSSGRLKVVGIFESGYYTFDSMSSFISTETFATVFSRRGDADFIHIKLDDPFDARNAAGRLASTLSPYHQITTWEHDNGAFFQSIKLQKYALFLILMLIVLVAGFNIIGTMILMVIEKTREIGIMKAMGFSDRNVRRVFWSAGMLIGGMGTLSGVALGLFGCFLLRYVIKLDMPPAIYNFDHLPVLVKPLTVLVIACSSLGISVLAGLFPAAQAARLNPVDALRHE